MCDPPAAFSAGVVASCALNRKETFGGKFNHKNILSMFFIGLNIQMDFCATPRSFPNTNGYHRRLHNVVDPGMGQLIMCEKDFTSRKRSHPDQVSRSTGCGMNSAEDEGVEEWGRAVPEQAKVFSFNG